MPTRAWIYIGAFYLGGFLVLGCSLAGGYLNQPDWLIFAIILGLTTLTQLFRAEAPSHQLYHPAYIFIFSALLLFDPFYFNLIVILAHLAEWLKERLLKSTQLQEWYIQPFNIAMHLLLANGTWLLIQWFTPPSGDLLSWKAFGGVILGAILYAALNHVLVGLVIHLARRVSLTEMEILDFQNLATDVIMLVLGYAAAILVALRPWLILPAIAPLYLIYRALSVPQLTQRANTDPKTGLWNAEYFAQALEVEILRAVRFSRPLTVVMADLDFLRNINNTYGHLAGDEVLIGVAHILNQSFREYDLVARFGGEEFAILIPETSPEQALHRIEAVREQIEATEFTAPTTGQRIKATMSFGVAGMVNGAMDSKELLHQADIAVYAAKLEGRNRTCIHSDQLEEVLAS